jgi:hypothetical protein
MPRTCGKIEVWLYSANACRTLTAVDHATFAGSGSSKALLPVEKANKQETQVRNYYKFTGGLAALAVMMVMSMTGAARMAGAQEKEKTAKDQGEFDISNEVVKDITTNNWSKAVQDLDIWTQRYPESDYKDDRLYDYLQAYAKATPPQPAKALEIGAQLMDKDLGKTFKDPRYPLNIYFLTATSAQSVQNPTPEQLALGDKAAHKLLVAAATFFTAANKPQGATDDAWTSARKVMDDAAKNYLFYEEVLPGNQAIAKKDCAAAETIYTKALSDYPEKGSVAYALAGAYRCEQKESQALYEYARVAATDPTLGGSQPDPSKIQAFVKKAYDDFHGGDDGYDQLLQQAKSSPLPPADFKIENASVLAAQKRADWMKANPEYAAWEGIKSSLATQGATFFDASMKDAGMPPLKGKVMSAKPECRSKELVISMPTEADANPAAEVTLKLDAPLAGKPDTGSEITFNGVARSFAPSPFMVTMEVETDKVQGLNVTPCAPPAAKKGITKKK